ncbi:uncharacterized protein LOC129572042 [Sitodiplosis mosellana]|uniref:uncharacterized protein LOC129572042 n=1 Tax=Sitodiplosis mosellana TaxID=263140 RepID=UPI002445208D|nr:uncharacterized protein LOC129572042 [Sitodiplosis mosellana]
MLYVLQVILLTLTLASALPAGPVQSEQEISDNDIDNDDFSDELPFEAEFYRTSTDRDEFVRPIPSPKDNEIDDGDGGIELNVPTTFVHTPNCTYHIAIRVFFESIDDLEIKLDGLTVESGSKNKISLSDFVQQAQVQVFNSIKGKNFTSELMNDVISYLRQAFVSAFGYDDNCGVSTNVVTYFTKDDTQADPPQMNEQTTDIPTHDEDAPGDTDLIDSETTTENDGDATEEYQPKTLTRPKLSDIVQDTIDVYKALNNWKYPQQS